MRCVPQSSFLTPDQRRATPVCAGEPRARARTSLDVLIRGQSPCRRMRSKPDFRVVIDRRRGTQEDDHGLAAGLLCSPNQFPPNPMQLMTRPHREIAQVGAVTKIRQRPRNPHHHLPFPSWNDQVRVLKHRPHAIPVIDRSPHPKRRGLIKLNNLVQIQIVPHPICDSSHPSRIPLLASSTSSTSTRILLLSSTIYLS